jgi:hypothetical protein
MVKINKLPSFGEAYMQVSGYINKQNFHCHAEESCHQLQQ